MTKCPQYGAFYSDKSFLSNLLWEENGADLRHLALDCKVLQHLDFFSACDEIP